MEDELMRPVVDFDWTSDDVPPVVHDDWISILDNDIWTYCWLYLKCS